MWLCQPAPRQSEHHGCCSRCSSSPHVHHSCHAGPRTISYKIVVMLPGHATRSRISPGIILGEFPSHGSTIPVAEVGALARIRMLERGRPSSMPNVHHARGLLAMAVDIWPYC